MDFATHLKSYLSDEEIQKLTNEFTNDHINGLLLNLNKLSVDKILAKYPTLKPHPIVKNAFIFNANQLQPGKNIYHELGAYYIQEPSAMIPSYLLDINEDDLVLDFCAAPGGKTIQAALKMKNKGLIVANDISKERANSIKENVERLGLKNVLIINNDLSLLKNKLHNTFTKIILDAPCSGSGMFKKSENMINDWTYEKVLKYQKIQKDLILLAYSFLKPGGLLSYSTCSFSKEEDEDVIQYLLDNSDAEINPIPENKVYKKGVNGLGIHILPHMFPGDGHFICQIKKPGILKINKENKESKMKFGDYIFTLPRPFDIKGLNIVRYGLLVGEYKGNDLIYSNHYAHAITDFNTVINIDKNQMEKYHHGEQIATTLKKGELALLKYDGLNVDITKSDGCYLKNRYPKYLRNKNIEY